MTEARDLSHHTLETIQRRFRMKEIHGEGGGPFIPLMSAFGPAGELRLFSGGVVQKMVYIGMAAPSIGLDSHMIFAFTPPDSALPHFTLDSVMNMQNASQFAFHLDLIPRVDLGAHLGYLDAVFTPLTEIHTQASQIEGLSAAKLTLRQYALMSPWMLVYRADQKAFSAIQQPVNAYLDHWSRLIEEGLPDEVMSQIDPASLAERDRRSRAAIFNPEVDAVWAQVDRLLGAETSAKLRDILKNPQVEM